MTSDLSRRLALVAGGAAIVAMGALTACGTTNKEAPTTGTPSGSATPSASESTSAPLSPTEKKVAPLTPGGPNSFTPTVKVHTPGAVCTQIVGNTCVR